MKGNPLLDLAERLIAADERVKSLDDLLDAAKRERTALNKALAEAMIDAEMQSVSLKGRLLYLGRTTSVAYDKGLEAEFFAALGRHGFGDIIRPTVNARTLTAAVTKELMEEDEDGNRALPKWLEEYVSVYEEPKVGIRKG